MPQANCWPGVAARADGLPHAIETGARLARPTAMPHAHTWATVTTTVATSATWRHEHPATCQRRHQRNHQRCAENVLQLHYSTPENRT